MHILKETKNRNERKSTFYYRRKITYIRALYIQRTALSNPSQVYLYIDPHTDILIYGLFDTHTHMYNIYMEAYARG